MGTALIDDAAVDDRPVDASADGGADETGPATRPIHRLRDLDRRGRWIAALFAGALALAPLLAFAWAAPGWTPSNDPALMALRSLDVGTSRTPLTGQPSTSANYTSDRDVVNHPGPTHFYLMAPAVRVLGVAVGMLTVSVLITGGCVLLAAWAVYRQLGPPGGVIGAVVLGAITFTTGASTLINPVSSNIARYPLLCSMVLVWCLLCGDIRLLPLASAMLSFTAQQHLSVLPTVGVVAAAGTIGFLVAWGGQGRWREPEARRRLAWWGGGAVAVALVIWSPVLYQQFFGKGTPNLTAMATFAQHDERPSLGMGSAVRQAAHVLGLPPILGQLNLSGEWLLADVSPFTWVTAAAVVVLTAFLGWRWRRTEPRRTAMVIAAGIVLAAGLVNGSSVPEGLEKLRLSLYHWAWPLVLFVTLALGLAVVDLAKRVPLLQRPWVPTLACGLAALAIVVPSAANPRIDRRSNTLMDAYSPVERGYLDQLVDQVLAERDQIDGPVVLLERGQRSWFNGLREALAVELEDRGGLVVQHPRFLWMGIHHDRLADRDAVRSGLVLVVDEVVTGDVAAQVDVPGRVIAEVGPDRPFDREAFDELVDQATTRETVEIGADGQRAIERMSSDRSELFRASLFFLPAHADEALVDRETLEFLRDHPLDAPRLDPDLIDRVLDSLPAAQQPRLRVFLLDRDEIRDFARPGGEL
jgi:hypothetical protein